MHRTRRLALAVTLAVLSASCASVGASDPVLVKAEDLQVNSLALFDAGMQAHFANSTRESPQVYQAFEKIRTAFPPAWNALSAGIKAYRLNKDVTALIRVVAVVQAIVDELGLLGVRG